MINLLDFKLINLIPQYMKENKEIIAFCEAWDKQKDEVIRAANKLELIKRIGNEDLSPEEVELLLYENHVDYFDNDIPHQRKIRLVKSSFDAHQKKGTVATIEEQLDILLDEFRIYEWFDMNGEPNTFYVLGRKYPEEPILLKVEKIIKCYKRASAHLEPVFGIFDTPTIIFKAKEFAYEGKFWFCGNKKLKNIDNVSTSGFVSKGRFLTKESMFSSEEIKKTGVITKNSTGKYNKEFLLSSEKAIQSNLLKIASENEKNKNTGVSWKESSNYNFTSGCGCNIKFASETTKTRG